MISDLQPGTPASARAVANLARAGLAALCLLAAGCRSKEVSTVESVTRPPVVRLVQPEGRTIVRTVGQPSFIESYERTSIYPKLTGYIEQWNVDIGDRVKKNDVLATLFVPELVEDWKTKKATVKLDEERIELAKRVVEICDADVKSAEAKLEEARAILAKYQSEVDRWETEVARLQREVKRGVVDPQILLESTNQARSATASRDSAAATITQASADLLSRQAALAKARVDVDVAVADLAVAVSDAKRIEAWVGYITLASPYDGVVVARNANTGDFVQPSNGDPTAMSRSPDLAPGGTAAPIFVVDRTDIVRIFVDIPEQDANFVEKGTKASVMVKAFSEDPIPAEVTRTAWALNVKSRTLRAEIDLPNTRTELLPGMYAYAKVVIERPGVKAVPTAALVYVGDRTYCWTYESGKAVRTEVRTGVTDGKWIEITFFEDSKSAGKNPSESKWRRPTGSEQIILGDLSILVDGTPVDLEKSTGEAEKVAASHEPAAATPNQGAG